MRMMMKITMPTEHGNRAIREGVMQKVMQTAMETMRPEAAYFTVENGHRTAFMFVDMKNTADMPVWSEPFFSQLNAEVQWTPAMNPQELQEGLGRVMRK